MAFTLPASALATVDAIGVKHGIERDELRRIAEFLVDKFDLDEAGLFEALRCLCLSLAHHPARFVPAA